MLTGLVLLLTLLWVPETVTFLVARRPADALERVNRTLALFGRAAVGAQPRPAAAQHRRAVQT